MLIWLGKNILGQRDVPVDSTSTDRLDEVLRALQTDPAEGADGIAAG